MQNLEKNSSLPKMAGNKKIFIAPTDEIAAINLTSQSTQEVVMNQGFTFGKIDAEDINFASEQEKLFFSTEVTCKLRATNNAYDLLFAEMANKRWIVKVVDNSDKVWLLGSLEEPLKFSCSHKSDANASGDHLYILSFARDSSDTIYRTTL